VRALDVRYDGEDALLLAVDPATFADGVGWDRTYAARPLPDLLASLGAGGPGGAPAWLAGDGPDEGDAVLRFGGALRVPVVVTQRPAVVPFMSRTGPTLVADLDRLPAKVRDVAPTLWTTATEDEARAAVVAAGARVVRVTTADRLLDTSAFLPVTWTFGFVAVVGAVVAVVAVMALAAYLGLGARARALAEHLLARMGLRAAQRWAAAALELALLAGAAVAAGVAAGWVAVRRLPGLVDAAPAFPPGALLRFPSVSVGAVVVVATLAVVLAASVASWAAHRTDLAGVLRAGA
jgi:putative ABC transport system permease protein